MAKAKTIRRGFKKISIKLASPEIIKSLSYGEVVSTDTKNHRTHKAEKGGLFCPRIFGPEENWRCDCGKYKGIRYRSTICTRCGVEITEKKVRRERMGHIELASYVVHPWFYRHSPNIIGYLLGIPSKKLSNIIYYSTYVVIQPGSAAESGLQYLDVLNTKEYLKYLEKLPQNENLSDRNPDKFIAKMGAEAIRILLKTLDLEALSLSLRHQIENETSQQRRTYAIKRLKIVESFLQSSEKVGMNKPEWMILKSIPVISPDYRPIVVLNNGRLVSSDITELFKILIMRNNRLIRYLDPNQHVPRAVIENEQRLLQEAVEGLFDNSPRLNTLTTDKGRPFKSLSDTLKGKGGLLRGNLLGKRVDFSGRSVITVGPHLKLYQCGLPKEMALILFEPFLIRELKNRGLISTFKEGKKYIQKRDNSVWEILTTITKEHPIMLNRAPTLHRLGIQAFFPILIEGKSIQLHPLVCTAFNADFDGDQMAVHVPLSTEARAECIFLMLASRNLLNPANGRPIMLPTKDMVLGLYYLTKKSNTVAGQTLVKKTFVNTEEVLIAYHNHKLGKHDAIKVYIKDKTGKKNLLETTTGRVLFNQYLPQEIGFVNETIDSKNIANLVGKIYQKVGLEGTAFFLDEVKDLGFQIVHEGGLTFSLDDMKSPTNKAQNIEEGEEEVAQIKNNFAMGLITDTERYNQTIDVWTRISNQITSTLLKELEKDKHGFNTLFMMMHSGARGSKDQIKQLCGLRGLMSRPQTQSNNKESIIEQPVFSSLADGLSPAEYFTSTHGSRKALADTNLKTADCGYLNRKLIDISQSVIITKADCYALRGRVITPLYGQRQLQISVGAQIVGRILAKDVLNPRNNSVLFKRGDQVTEAIAEEIDKRGIIKVEVRSPIYCKNRYGICVQCYGVNLATQQLATLGDAVGNIGGQSISEPTTQITLRMFHTGGAVSGSTIEDVIKSLEEGTVQIANLKAIEKDGKTIVINRGCELKLIGRSKHEIQNHILPYGAVLLVKDQEKVQKGQPLFEWDLYQIPILTTKKGIVVFEAIEEGVTYKEEYNEQTGHREKIIIESQDKYKAPSIIVKSEDGGSASYVIPTKAHLNVQEGARVAVGDILAKIPRPKNTPQNIVGGLRRITKMFEMQESSNPAVLASIDGQVRTLGKKRNKVLLSITAKNGFVQHHDIPIDKQLLIQEGDYVKAGDYLCDGFLSGRDILAIKGLDAFCNYLIGEIQAVYRLQGITINDKHLEIVLRQMLRKVTIISSGDTTLIPDSVVSKAEFNNANKNISGKKIIVDPGDTPFKKKELVSVHALDMENKLAEKDHGEPATVRDPNPAIAKYKVQGITSASTSATSFLAAASFQETVKVLLKSAIAGRVDKLRGIKENILIGGLIPAGTGMRQHEKIRVTSVELEKSLMEEKELAANMA